MFALHQQALVTRAWARAAHLLEHYAKRLQRHIELEERYLLPYCAEVKAPGRWPARVYLLEHRRLEELLNKAGTRLAIARRRGVQPAVVVALLDQEHALKHALEHHHQREDQALFAELRESLPAEARAQLAQALEPQRGATAGD
jgi:hemerythrin-like domain-containing protein